MFKNKKIISAVEKYSINNLLLILEDKGKIFLNNEKFEEIETEILKEKEKFLCFQIRNEKKVFKIYIRKEYLKDIEIKPPVLIFADVEYIFTNPNWTFSDYLTRDMFESVVEELKKNEMNELALKVLVQLI